MTTPIPGPWLSPQVEIVKSFPKLLGIAVQNREFRNSSPQGLTHGNFRQGDRISHGS